MSGISAPIVLESNRLDSRAVVLATAVVIFPQDSHAANGYWTVDNAGNLYLDGTHVSSVSSWTSNHHFTWHTSNKVIAIHGVDHGEPAGLIVRGNSMINSGTHWKCVTACPGGWETTSFDESSWPFVTSWGAFGQGPWGGNG
jgi:hypothetical protein